MELLQLKSFCKPTLFLQYLAVIIILIPFVAVFEDEEGLNMSNEGGSKYAVFFFQSIPLINRANRVRLGAIFLMFRIGTAYSLSWWLTAAMQQQRPCVCNLCKCFEMKPILTEPPLSKTHLVL